MITQAAPDYQTAAFWLTTLGLKPRHSLHELDDATGVVVGVRHDVIHDIFLRAARGVRSADGGANRSTNRAVGRTGGEQHRHGEMTDTETIDDRW